VAAEVEEDEAVTDSVGADDADPVRVGAEVEEDEDDALESRGGATKRHKAVQAGSGLSELPSSSSWQVGRLSVRHNALTLRSRAEQTGRAMPTRYWTLTTTQVAAPTQQRGMNVRRRCRRLAVQSHWSPSSRRRRAETR
jgi:hypothetical protein